MRWRYIAHIIGALIICVGLCMIFPIFFSLYYREGGLIPLIQSMGLTLGVGFVLFMGFRKVDKTQPMNHREGMAITSLGWAAAGIFGALPFFFSGQFGGLTNSVFESFSGFTTTGSSILSNIEDVSKGLLFWRSLTHWLGGMGIIVLSLAILPFLGVGGMQLYKAEVPGPIPDKLKPRIKDTAMVLWKVYLLISAVLTVLLMLGGMDLFDALCHTFGTMATGGFSTKNASIAYYQSAYIQYVITLFMLVAGINFSLHFRMLQGRPLVLWRDPECRTFLVIFSAISVLITGCIVAAKLESVPAGFRLASFQVASILTTTGYATADYEIWPPLTQCLLLFCMFVGGCAGSTGGRYESHACHAAGQVLVQGASASDSSAGCLSREVRQACCPGRCAVRCMGILRALAGAVFCRSACCKCHWRGRTDFVWCRPGMHRKHRPGCGACRSHGKLWVHAGIRQVGIGCTDGSGTPGNIHHHGAVRSRVLEKINKKEARVGWLCHAKDD